MIDAGIPLHMVNAFWHGSSLLLPSPQHRLRERVNSKEHGERLQFIGPGKPIQNAHIESHDGHLREECLNGRVFVHSPIARQDRTVAHPI